MDSFISNESNKEHDAFIDLHLHSYCSDGTDSPEGLAVEAQQAGLKAFAITDHDTLLGLKRARNKAKELGIECVSGIELSTDHTVGEVHILGYWLHTDPLENSNFQKAMDTLKEMRAERNSKLFKNLAKVGVDLTEEEVREYVYNATDASNRAASLTDFSENKEDFLLCRPHIALVMCAKKFVPDIRTAFVKYLGIEGLAYTPKEKFSQQKAIELLHESKALSVFAHPYLTHCVDEKERKALIKKLKDYGLDGIETLYSMNSKDQTAQTRMYAKEFGLAITGGSDYHGKVKPHLSVGKGLGNLSIPYSVLENLRTIQSF